MIKVKYVVSFIAKKSPFQNFRTIWVNTIKVITINQEIVVFETDFQRLSPANLFPSETIICGPASTRSGVKIKIVICITANLPNISGGAKANETMKKRISNIDAKPLPSSAQAKRTKLDLILIRPRLSLSHKKTT